MSLAPQIAVPVGEPNQAGEARRAAIRLAETIGFDEQARGEVAIVATELATNLARYAQHGSLLLHALDLPAGRTIEVLSIDSGPGITDLRACLQDGYSTGGTPGNGLGAVRRLSTVFDIFSSAAGTAIVSRVSRGAEPRQPPSPFVWGVVSLPAPREQVCGDAWRIAEGEAGCAVMVADGLGHGPLAAEASRLAGDVFDDRPFDDAVALIERAHRALAGSRGAALAIATIAGGTLRFAGVGNIAGVLHGGERPRGLASQNGTIGVQMRRAMALEYPWPPAGRLVMHSDGLSSRWTLESYPGLAMRHPALAAAVLWRDCGRGRDDATIVVVGHGTSVPNHG